MVKAGKVGKRSDGAISATIRAEETKLRPYVTIHVTTTPSNSPLGLYLLETYGGRDRTRTCDLLRVNNRGSLQPFYLLLGFSTTWGVCFRSADIL